MGWRKSLKNKAKIAPAIAQKDIFRETPLRYAGYANEVGEAFRFALPWLLKPSYMASFIYVFGDVYDKGRKQFLNDGGKLTMKSFVQSIDCFLWQTLATVIIPGFIIHKAVDASRSLIMRAPPGRASVLGAGITRAVPVAVGLATIPIIIHPVDHAVTEVMDRTIRTQYHNICSMALPLPKALTGG